MPTIFAFTGSLVAASLATAAVRAFLAGPQRGAFGTPPQPLMVAENWGIGIGLTAWAALAFALACAYAIYLAILRTSDNGSGDDVRKTLFTIAAGVFYLINVPLLYSADLYAYAGYGWLQLHGIDPYRSDGGSAATAFMQSVRIEWPDLPRCIYGPAFVALAASAVALAGGAMRPTLALLRAESVIAFAMLLWAVWTLARRRGENASAAVATIGLHPVALWSIVEGHNDAWMAAVACAGLVLARRAPFWGAALAGASGALKAVGVVGAAAYGFASSRRPRALAGAALGVATATLSYLPFVDLHRLAGASGLSAPSGAFVAAVALKALAAAFVLALALRLARGGAAPMRPWALAAFAAWCAIPSAYPWYAIWLLPVAAFARNTPEGDALLLASLCGLLRYIPDVVGADFAAPAIALLETGIPLGAYAWSLRASSPRYAPVAR